MEIEVIPLSKVASTIAVPEETVALLVHRGILPVLEPSGSEEPMVPAYAVEQVRACAYRGLLRHHITLAPTDPGPELEHRWNDYMEHWLSHHYDERGFMLHFLRYVAAMTKSHSFKGFKTMLGIEAEGRYCNLVPQVQGLVLTATCDKKPIRYVVRSWDDLAGGLAWILSLKHPRGRA